MVLEPGRARGLQRGQRDPELETVQPAILVRACSGRRLLGVRDPVAGRHQVQLSGLDQGEVAEAVAVQHLAVDQPRDGLQAAVRMRRHLHAGAVTERVGPEVVEEAPRADHAPMRVRQQSVDRGVAPERHGAAFQQIEPVDDRDIGGVVGLGRSRFEVAHCSSVGLTATRAP